jgi:hypothetical protein
MAGNNKPEFAPLLPPGRHTMTLEAIAHLCVTPFENSVTRHLLMDHLKAFVVRLREHIVVCDLWIDGSFISEKVDPEDIDLTFVVSGDVYDNLPPLMQAEIDAFGDGQQLRPYLHVFPIVTRPMGHQNHMVIESMVRNMAQWWCVARGGWLKGMPVIRLGETDVGLRVLS